MIRKGRGVLYKLKPIEYNSWPLESLTGYCLRLAEEHCCLTGSLLKYVISNSELNESIKQMVHRGGGSPFYKRSFLVNGASEGADNFAQAIEHATGYQGLAKLTMVPLRSVLSDWYLSSRLKRWCPYCYEESKTILGTAYDQLLWCFNIVHVCPIHEAPLEERCPVCENHNYYFENRARAGHCSKCGYWLGRDLTINLESINDPWHLYVSRTVNELLLTQHGAADLVISNAIHNIKLYIQQHYGGNKRLFAANFQLPETNVYSWLQGKHNPSIESLLKIAFKMNIAFVELLKITNGDVRSTEVVSGHQKIDVSGANQSMRRRKNR
ncbi:TniQ family protein [Paenibacillus sp. CC-CFT747]|nr:TniQ family protein [Paenibacillus sp. CC-CFT747]